MTKRQFLSALAKFAAKSGDWQMLSTYLIRYPIFNLTEYDFFCPITAVCSYLGKGAFPSYDYDLAAERIGLDMSLAKDIVEASDRPRINLDRKGKMLRTEILKAVGIR